MNKTIKIRAKRLIASATGVAACLSIMTSSAFAEVAYHGAQDQVLASDADLPDNIGSGLYITADDCRMAGKKWITAHYSENTEVRDIVAIRNLSGGLAGYCIDFSTDGVPAGYLVLNADKYADNYIEEFAFEGSGIYDELAADIPMTVSADTQEKVIYATSPYRYAVKFAENDEIMFYNDDGGILTTDAEMSAYPIDTDSDAYPDDPMPGNNARSEKEEYIDAFIDANNLSAYASKNDIAITGARNFKPTEMGEFTDASNENENKNNCIPTAALNICRYYAQCKGLTNLLIDNDIYKTYNQLAVKVKFDKNSEALPSFGDLQSGLKSYAEGRGYNAKVGDYLFDWWSDFTRDINGDYPIAIVVGGDKKGTNGVWTTGAHAVVGIGYLTTDNGERYIRVCDGWHSYQRFLHFKDSRLSRFDGAVVDIS